MESRSSYPVLLNLITFTTMHQRITLGGVHNAAGRCDRLMAEMEEEAEVPPHSDSSKNSQKSRKSALEDGSNYVKLW